MPRNSFAKPINNAHELSSIKYLNLWEGNFFFFTEIKGVLNSLGVCVYLNRCI